jgi:hypothetical protein
MAMTASLNTNERDPCSPPVGAPKTKEPLTYGATFCYRHDRRSKLLAVQGTNDHLARLACFATSGSEPWGVSLRSDWGRSSIAVPKAPTDWALASGSNERFR